MSTIQINSRKVSDIASFLIPIVTINSVVIAASFFIPIIDINKSFVPCHLEYLRTFILATTSAIVLHFANSKLSSYLYHLKPALEFLALEFLAYPQRTEIDQTFSEWNLVKRESFLFGAIFNLASQLLYSYDDIMSILQSPNYDELLHRQQSNEDINQLVRERATLDNCIQVRRNSHTLKKNVYSQPNSKNHSISETESLLKNQDPGNTLVIDYNSDSIEFLHPSSSYIPEGSKTPTGQLTPSHTNYGSIGSVHSITLHPIKSRWSVILENCILSVCSSFYEIGISLILSITFIYVPELDGCYFSWLEKYYYNNIFEFALEIILPLTIVTSLVHFQLFQRFQSQIKLTLFFYAVTSIVLFVFGLLNT